MLVSHDYSSRLMSDLGVQCPSNRENVTDEIFSRIIQVNGAHQCLIDISRCYVLTSQTFQRLKICTLLQFLDLSYTKVTDLTFLSSCGSLRGLNLAGLQLQNDSKFEPLINLVHLEILVLRSSNILSGARLKGLDLLRSLDVGETKIDSIEFVRGFRRLEELAMDHIPLMRRGSHIQDCIGLLASLPSLRLLNVRDTPLDSHRNALLTADREICLETTTRRYMYEAVIANDAKETEQQLLLGQDVNMRAGAWAKDLFMTSQLKQQQGQGLMEQLPYFSYDIKNKNLRPQAIHFAIYFNCKDVLRVLLQFSCEIDGRVWLGPMTDLKQNDTLITAGDSLPSHNPSQILEVAEEEVCTSDLGASLFTRRVYQYLVVQREIRKHLFNMTTAPDYTQMEEKETIKVVKKSAKICKNLEVILTEKNIKELSKAEEAEKIEHLVEERGARDYKDTSSLIPVMDRKLLIGQIMPKDDTIDDWRKHFLVQKLIGRSILVRSSTVDDDDDDIEGLGESRRSITKGFRYSFRKGTFDRGEKSQMKKKNMMTVLGAKSFWGEGRRQCVKDGMHQSKVVIDDKKVKGKLLGSTEPIERKDVINDVKQKEGFKINRNMDDYSDDDDNINSSIDDVNISSNPTSVSFHPDLPSSRQSKPLGGSFLEIKSFSIIEKKNLFKEALNFHRKEIRIAKEKEGE